MHLPLSLLVSIAAAVPVDAVPNPRERDAWVSDAAGVLDPATEAALNHQIDALHRDLDVEIAIVTVADVDGTPAAFATRLLERWGIGDAVADNGLLVLVVMEPRRLEMETGSGLELALPDDWLRPMERATMAHELEAGRIGPGLVQGLAEIDGRIRQQLGPYGALDPYQALRALGWLGLAGVGGVGLWWGAMLAARRRRRICPTCNILMDPLDAAADHAHLPEGHPGEEEVGPVDYDVLACRECGTVRALPLVRWFSSYSPCPSCAGRSRRTSTRVGVPPTRHAVGVLWVSEQCVRCTYARTYTRVIPVLPVSSSSSDAVATALAGAPAREAAAPAVTGLPE